MTRAIEALLAAALAEGVDPLEDLLEERLGAEEPGQGVVLDEVELGHGDGHVLARGRWRIWLSSGVKPSGLGPCRRPSCCRPRRRR
jgi:hypothetical protein